MVAQFLLLFGLEQQPAVGGLLQLLLDGALQLLEALVVAGAHLADLLLLGNKYQVQLGISLKGFFLTFSRNCLCLRLVGYHEGIQGRCIVK